MSLAENKNGYSAQVQISLEVNGQLFPVAQVGEHSLILQEPIEIFPESNARLIITVDGRTTAYPVVIESVDSEQSREIEFRDWLALSTEEKEYDGIPF